MIRGFRIPRLPVLAVLSSMLTLGVACVGDSAGNGGADADSGQPDSTAADAQQSADTSIALDAFMPDSAVATDAGTTGDAGGDARCNPTKPWGMPQEVLGVNTVASESGARLSQDELTIYFSSDRMDVNGGVHLWVATRSNRSAAFGTPTQPSGIVEPFGGTRQIWPSLTGNGLSLYYSEFGLTGGDPVGAFKATRATNPGTFGVAAPLLTVGDGSAAVFGTSCTYVLPDDSALYLCSKTAAGKYDLFRASPPGSVATIIPELVGDPYDTISPVVSPSDLYMAFSSTRGSKSDHDIYETKRAATSDPWGVATRIDALDTGGDDYPTWISPDSCVLYFARPVTPGSPDYNVWYTTRGQ